MKTNDYQKIKGASKDCFACGPENPHGLHMSFETNGESLRSIVPIQPYMRGWHNLVHGGILSTICDEIMSWSALHLTRRFILTKNLNVSYLKPATIGQKLTATGFIKERIDDRNAIVACEIRDEKGELCTKGLGEFALFTPEYFRKLNIMPDELIDEMMAVFE
ncbi:MAG: PaaI family thioesterase [Desulfobacteraceae bacterium]|nr:PaaI family thioesterase [Desulfobacteraceae bacterium]